jgi:hypothetical protein
MRLPSGLLVDIIQDGEVVLLNRVQLQVPREIFESPVIVNKERIV